VRAGLKRELRDVGRRRGWTSRHACMHGSAAVAGKTGLTGWAHGVEARMRSRLKRYNADGAGPQRRESGGTCAKGAAPIGRPQRAEGEKGGCARGRGWPDGLKGREGGVAGLFWVFSSEFLFPFLFILSFEFKSNQTINSNLNISNMCINQKQSLSSA
jgi:hypothetical protein